MSTKKPNKKDNSFNPLKNIKTEANSAKSGKSLETYDAKEKAAIDQYVQLIREIKNLESQSDTCKDSILSEAKSQFAKRQMSGKAGNFKMLGNDETLTFICQNAGSTLKDENYQELVDFAGKKAAENLLESDVSSLKFNPDFIKQKENQDRIFAALAKAFSQDELAEMFLPVGYKPVDNVIEKATDYAKNADQLEKIYTLLKLKAYIKV
jgi:hypothetical protein